MNDVYKLRLKFQGKDWKEYEFVVNEFSVTEVLHKDLNPADSSCRLACLPDVELNNLLLGMGEYDTPAKVIKNGVDFFTGYIKKNCAGTCFRRIFTQAKTRPRRFYKNKANRV